VIPTSASTPSRRHLVGSAVGTALTWIGLRLAMFAIFVGRESSVSGDPHYYFTSLSELGSGGLAQVLVEYPTPVVWFLEIPQLWAAPGGNGYAAAFALFMLLLEGGLAAALWWCGRHVGPSAALWWAFFTFLVGPLVWYRFDVVPAVLAASALLVVANRPGVAGGLVAVGAALKLWPALLVAGLWGDRAGRWRTWLGFGATGLALVVVSLVAGGWQRLISPLGWQGDRGLQIESVWATPLMVNALFHPARYQVGFSAYNAYEIFGPGVPTMLVLSSVATVLGGVAIIVLAVRAWRSPGYSPAAAALIMTTVVAVMITTNKTFSPQYIVWLGGPLAVLALTPRPAHRDDGRRTLLVLGLVLAALTQLVYPLTYGWLATTDPGADHTLATAILAARNVGILVFTVLSCSAAWRALDATPDRAAQPRSEPRHAAA